MAKRFCDTELWKNQRWFRKLPPLYKLAFCYIRDQCNHAGIWKIECSDLIDDLGIDTFDIVDFVSLINTEYDKMTGSKAIKERLVIVHNNLLWMTGFIQFQYEGKDKKVGYLANATRSALWLLDNIKINPSEPFRTLPNPSEQSSLLEYGISHLHIKVKEPLPVFVEGLRTLMDKDRDKDNVVKLKNNENGKFGINYKAQGENLFAKRDSEHRDKIK